MNDPSTSADHETLDGYSPRVGLVVYHRDGLEVVPLEPDVPVVIGRTEPSDIRPRSRRLSRRHAAFELSGGVVHVQDLGSTNGTFVNGHRVTSRVPISLGDEVTLGSVTVSLHGLDEEWLQPLGLERHERFEEHVSAELARSRIFGRPLTVCMIRARGPEGPKLGAWVPKLSEHLRMVDRAALFGPDSVEVLLPEMDRAGALAFAQQLWAQLAQHVEVYVGLVTWPLGSASQGESAARQLVEAARAAVMAATPESPIQVHPDPSHVQPITFPEGPDSDGPVVLDPAMVSLYRTVDRMASSVISALIIGETGTGKELIARAIHEGSTRRQGPMRVINCGAIPENLLESTLFGHERGAFTGAAERRTGVFEDADGGTVFLDEIGELSLQAQVALLRVLETRKIQRVGSSKEIAVDVRVLAATHRNLESMCADGSFRWDLLYRLNGITLLIPPLRERLREIRPMVAHFLRQSNLANGRNVRGIAPDALTLLERYPWPGNVRELRNTIDRAVVIAAGDTITVEDLPERLVSQVDLSRLPTESSMMPSVPPSSGPPTMLEFDLKERVKAYEIELIRSALHDAQGNQTHASSLLAIPRRTLVYKMRAYGIQEGETSPALASQRDYRGRPVEFAQRVEQFERALIEEALARCGGDPSAAARMLNIQRRTLNQKLDRHGLG
jgi:DNA-binding NtrC family response regulator